MKGFGKEPEGRNHLEEQGVEERNILKWIFEKWDWIDLAQDRER